MVAYPLRRHVFINLFANIYWRVVDLLAHNFDVFASGYYNRSIGNEYRKEYQRYKISSEDSILHIGCGMFPLTEITLAKQTKATIVGIDKDKRIIKKAMSSVHQYGLDHQIRIMHGAGENYPLSLFSVIIISSCASPKQTILDHIITEITPGTKIIIREVESSARPLFNAVSKKKNLTFYGSLHHNPFPFYSPFGWESQCYIKKEKN